MLGENLLLNSLAAGLSSNIVLLIFLIFMAMYGRDDKNYFTQILCTILACFVCSFTALSIR